MSNQAAAAASNPGPATHLQRLRPKLKIVKSPSSDALPNETTVGEAHGITWTAGDIRGLCEQIMEEGLKLMLDGRVSTTHQIELLGWFRDDSSRPFSFNACCSIMGVDADEMRTLSEWVYRKKNKVGTENSLRLLLEHEKAVIQNKTSWISPVDDRKHDPIVFSSVVEQLQLIIGEDSPPPLTYDPFKKKRTAATKRLVMKVFEPYRDQFMLSF